MHHKDMEKTLPGGLGALSIKHNEVIDMIY